MRMHCAYVTRASGGIGRRAGFRCQCLHGRGGSSPPSRTARNQPFISVKGCFAFRLNVPMQGNQDVLALQRLNNTRQGPSGSPSKWDTYRHHSTRIWLKVGRDGTGNACTDGPSHSTAASAGAFSFFLMAPDALTCTKSEACDLDRDDSNAVNVHG